MTVKYQTKPNMKYNESIKFILNFRCCIDVVCIEHLLSNEMIESVMTYYNSKTIKDNKSKTPKQA